MTQTWTIDYNERFKDYPEIWKLKSRGNVYVYYLNDSLVYTKYFIERYNINSIIDYGCGFGRSMHGYDVPVFRYDPFVEKFKEKPTQPADLVVAYRVFPVIENEKINEFLEEIVSLTNKMLIFSMTVQTGENSRNEEWYLKKLMRYIPEPFKFVHTTRMPIEKYRELSNDTIPYEKKDMIYIYLSKDQPI
jgi:hypothetical protein